MYSLVLLWTGSAAATLLLYVLVSLWFDRRIVLSCWIRLALGIMGLLGPLGTLLAAAFLAGTFREVRQHQRLNV